MHLFYIPEIKQDFCELPENEAKHALRVLRLKVGDAVQVMNGKGSFFDAKIIDADKKHCRLKVLRERKVPNNKFELHIAAAPTKNNSRYEFFIEKSVEIGINKITPLLCKFSERRKIRADRFEKIIVAAMKQSHKAYKPVLNELQSFKVFVERCNFTGQKFIAHCYDTAKVDLKNAYTAGNNALILIGPEGDFSKEEVRLAEQNGFTGVNLSHSRLRTETAAVVACHTINLLNNTPHRN